jgi:hypothetical protein
MFGGYGAALDGVGAREDIGDSSTRQAAGGTFSECEERAELGGSVGCA